MNHPKTSRTLALAVACLVLVGAPAVRSQNPVTPKPRVEIAFNRFYDYEELVDEMRKIAKAWPDLVTLESIGKSFEGRDMWVATVANRGGTPIERRPAMWVDANVHGNEIQGGEVCLYTLWFLTENSERNAKVKDLLATKAFYILPSQNPDGRDYWFHNPNTSSSSRSGKMPIDDDRDGVADEDPPNDLDGDGSITQMRKRVDHGGTFNPDPDDPRIMKRVKPGEDGHYILLGSEGIDDDGDGQINEDGPGGYDMNRNWPSDWQPDHVQFGAGAYPLSNPECRCIADFILAHPNIAAVQSYHNAGGMILRGPGAQSFGDYPGSDAAVYDRIGKVGEEMLPFYRYMIIWRDLYTVHGGFVNWTYEGLGIFSITNELWSAPQYYGRKDGDGLGIEARDDLARMKWDDRVELGARFAEWKPYKHPLYGDIEIGGWKKDASRVPPTFMLEELCHRNMAFSLYHAGEMPRIDWDAPEVTEVSTGLWRIQVEIRNRASIPTRAAIADQKGIGTPDRITFSMRNGRVISGGTVSGPYRREKTALVKEHPERLLLDGGIPGNGSVKVAWLVSCPSGKPEFGLRFDAEKGGRLER